MKARKNKKQVKVKQPEEIIPEPIPHKKLYTALSFLLPVAYMAIIFALHRVYPFGNRQILVTDFWQQYYAFLSDFWHKVRGGTLAPWSWTPGTGSDYISLIAYYMASPLNLLTVLAPHAYLREALTVILVLKIGFAGLFMGMFLRYTYRQSGREPDRLLALPVFASLYALCGFTLGYYWNIMWFDSFAMLPLVMQGLIAIMRESKYRLYIASLAFAVMTNYYIGFFICVFVVITFLNQCVILKLNRRDFLRKLAMVAACSILAIGLTAVYTVPAYISLQSTHTSASKFPSSIIWFNNYAEVLGNLVAFTVPTTKEGLPNLYCGMISVLLMGMFFRSPKIPLREKIVNAATLVFLLLSCNMNVLDYMWNAFHYSNMLPFRFSFLFSFVLVSMAYRVFLLKETMNRRDLAAMGIFAAFFILMAIISGHYKNFIIGNAGLCVLYLLCRDISTERKTGKLKIALDYGFLLLILGELFITSHIGINTNNTTYRKPYPDSYDQVQEVLSLRESAGSGFYRTEMAAWYTLNDPSLYGYNGISFYSSTVNVGVTKFMEGIGLPAWDAGNRHYYAETSPLTNAFLNLRYLVSRGGEAGGNANGKAGDDSVFWKTTGNAGDTLLLENKRYLPLGFMVNKELSTYIHDANPFVSQNSLFRLATGLSGDLFTVRDATNNPYLKKDENGNEKLNWDYIIQADGMFYAYCIFSNEKNVSISYKYEALRTIEINRPYLFTLGSFSKGDVITFTTGTGASKGTAKIQVGCIDNELFDRGYALLADEKMNLTEFSETTISGSITALKDGLLYTSVPNDKNWSARVDGVSVPIIQVDGCMIALRLDAGTHSVEFRYSNRALITGIVISLLSLGVFAFLFVRKMASRELVSYLFFGAATTFVNWCVYGLAVRFAGFSVTSGNVIAWIVAVVFAFVTNKIWVFESRSWQPLLVLREGGAFLGARIVSGLVEIVGVPFLYRAGLNYPFLGIEGFAAKITVSVIVIVLNYIFSKLFIFRRKEAV
jgi:uncharacterized membrane protein YfhO/putative flippase GtrA